MGSILLVQCKNHPKMAPQDLVKLLYQNTFGPRHLHGVPDRERVMAYLEEELQDVYSRGRFLEDIGNGYVRVHLDAIVDGRMPVDRLVDAFVTSMHHSIDVDAATMRFMEALDDVGELAKAGKLSFPEETWQTYLATYLAQGIRPVHHSTMYKEHYDPHYRVVLAHTIQE